MGSAQSNLSDDVAQSMRSLANDLGRAIAAHNCTLITGATTGFPDLISRAARSAGAVTIGVSPAQSREEHVECTPKMRQPVKPRFKLGLEDLWKCLEGCSLGSSSWPLLMS